MEVYGSVTLTPKVVFIKLPCICKSGTVGDSEPELLRFVSLSSNTNKDTCVSKRVDPTPQVHRRPMHSSTQ